MTRNIIAIAFVFLFTSMAATVHADTASKGAVLTIAGNIEKSNRGKFDPFSDAFLRHHEKSFEKAFSVSAEMLASLKQHKVTASVENWPKKIVLHGPLLRDVLALAGANDKPVTIYALDGYGADFSVEKMAAHEWVLATHSDGNALAIGGRGPLWLGYDTGGKTLTEEEESGWVWAAFYIEVGEK